MGIFNFGFFGTPSPRGFRYTPLTYDKDKEALKEKFGVVDGYVGKPASARKSLGNQYFFVNGRFFRSL